MLWGAVVITVASLTVLVWVLPVDRALDRVTGWVDTQGIWGPVVYGLIFTAGVVLLVPGWTMAVTAGAVFGLGWGVVSSGIGYSVGAALAFLIGRYVAREPVARIVRTRPRLNAIDTAMGQGGWKLVALLRVTPVVPFNLSNYVFGVTAIRFWPFAVANGLFMLPAAMVFVYFGHVGGMGLALAGGSQTVEPAGVWTWVGRGLGFALGGAVLVYLTRLALRTIRQKTTILEQPMTEHPDDGANATQQPGKAIALAVLALVLATATTWAFLERETVRGWFGPPAVVLAEAYDGDASAAGFDHSVFDTLLKRHVDEAGRVDYAALKSDLKQLDAYLDTLKDAPFAELGRDDKLALLINAYNAFTLKLILESYPLRSIRDIPAPRRWDDVRWNVGGQIWSLNQIEHEQIRAKFKEPRIHFALVCAAVGCPPLRREAYTGNRLEMQLEDHCRYVHTHDRWFKFDAGSKTVYLTKLYDWYGGDFKQSAGSVTAFAARYAPQLQQALDADQVPTIRWLEYDWSLNDAPVDGR
jgi:uncharacterized membrane protein YdjX (TVP38/TMEM64 family)